MIPTIRVDKAIDNLSKSMSNLSKQQILRAQSAAINRTLNSGRTEMSKQIRQVYNIPPADLKGMLISMAKPKASSLQGHIGVYRKPISLSHFKPKFDLTSQGKALTIKLGRNKSGITKRTTRSRGQAGKGVSVEIKKGSPTNIPYAFLVRNDSTNPVFARGSYNRGNSYGFARSKERLPITKLLTISASAASINPEVQKTVSSKVYDIFTKRMEHEIRYRVSKM